MNAMRMLNGNIRDPGRWREGAADEEEEAEFPCAEPPPELPWPPVEPGAPPYQPAGGLVSEGGGYCVREPGGQL